MTFREEPFLFDCANERLVGVVAIPDSANDLGVLIVIGGPQYRVGSHRQFVLLAREMAAASIPSMRFDFRGAGDATGEQRTYEDIGPDIASAITEFFTRVPHLKHVVLWGLCGAASAALFYAYRDPRVAGLVLVNPWVRTEEGMARTYLRHYYGRRLLDPQFWRKVASGDFKAGAAVSSFASMLRNAALGRRHRKTQRSSMPGADVIDPSLPLPARMAAGLALFAKDVLIVLSSEDYMAQEFRGAITGDSQWEQSFARNRVTWREVADANHTFATREWRDQLTDATRRWLLDLSASAPSVQRIP
jgi:uncharacterized protein